MIFCHHGCTFTRRFYKIKGVGDLPNSYLFRQQTHYLHPRGPRRAKMGPVGFWSVNCALWRIFYKTKVAEHLQDSGGGSLDPKSRSGRTCTQCASGDMVPNFQGEFVRQKLLGTFPRALGQIGHPDPVGSKGSKECGGVTFLESKFIPPNNALDGQCLVISTYFVYLFPHKNYNADISVLLQRSFD